MMHDFGNMQEFQLVDKEEMVPIQKLVETILKP